MTSFASHITKGTHAARPVATAVPSGSLYSCSDHSLVYQSDGATWSTWATLGSSGSGVLACTSYNPATMVNPTSTSTTLVDIDATNLAVTFTAPASGSVLVTLEGVGGNSGTTDGMSWGLRAGSSTVMPGGIVAGGSGTAVNNVFTKSFKITGLTPGASLTYKWAWASNTGTNTVRLFAGGVAGGANMTVTALP